MSYYIYSIRDIDKKPMYIGRSRRPNARLAQHLSGVSQNQALSLFMSNNPYSFVVIAVCATPREMHEVENELIKRLAPVFNRPNHRAKLDTSAASL